MSRREAQTVGSPASSSLIAPQEMSSAYDRFGHEDIWLAQPIGIGHHAYNHVALLLIKLIGMVLQVPEVGQVFADIRKEIDPRKGGLLIDVIGAQGNRQPSTFFDACFQ